MTHTLKLRVSKNIQDGIHYSTCSHDCPDACNFMLTVKNGYLVKVQGDPEHPYTNGTLCGKTPYEIMVSLNNNNSRLTQPLRKVNGQWETIKWDTALDLIAEKIKENINRFGPLSILHYHGAGSFAGLVRVINRRFFSLLGGTSTISGSICDTAGIEAQSMDFGDQRTHAPEDILQSKFTVIWGKNPANTGPHFIRFLKELRSKKVEIVAIDPIKTRTVNACTEHIQIAPNTDKYLALAIGKIMIEKKWIDSQFIQKHTIGYPDYSAIAGSVDVKSVASLCDISEKQIQSLAERYAKMKPSSIWLGFGLQRYIDGGETFRCIDALGAISGNIGKSGGGVSHQNSEVNKYFDYSLMLENTVKNKRYIRKTALGRDLRHAQDPPVKVVIINGVNPVAQCPNSYSVKEALEGTDFVVVIDAFMNDTARCADIVLPASRLLEEDEVMWAYGNHFIGLCRKILDPPGSAKSNIEIFQALSNRLGFGDEMSGNAKQWIDRILSPVAAHGICYESLCNGHQLINPNLNRVAFHDLKFTTPSGKFDFIRKLSCGPATAIGAQLKSGRENPYPYLLLSVHHHKWLNSNVFDDSQKKIMGAPPYLYMHSKVARKHEFRENEIITVSSSVRSMKATVKISDNYHPKAVVIYQGGSVADETCANIITDDSLISDFGEMAAYYSTHVALSKNGTDDRGDRR